MGDLSSLSEGEHGALRGRIEDDVDRLQRRRRARAAWVSGAVAVVLVGALAGAVLLGGWLRPAPAPVATGAPSPSVTTTSPSPEATGTTPSAPVLGDPSAWIVTAEGMGPYRIGMPVADAVALLPDARGCGPVGAPSSPAYSGWGSRLWLSDGAAEAQPSPGLQVAEWMIASNAQADPAAGPRTEAGIGPGSTAAEVKAAYPDATPVSRNADYLQSGRLYFAVVAGVVRGIGVTAGEIPYEFCG